MSATRTRCYSAIGYPESLNENFIDILVDTHVKTIISPLHDMDSDDDGNLKKAHYHIMLLFDSVKTIEQAQKIFDSIGCTQCIPVNSVQGQARYLCHLDNLDKHSYDVGNVICLNGSDYISLIELPTNHYQIVRDIINFCKENKIVSFSDILEYSSISNESWFRALCDNSAYVIKEYLKSKEWTVAKDTSKLDSIVEDSNAKE